MLVHRILVPSESMAAWREHRGDSLVDENAESRKNLRIDSYEWQPKLEALLCPREYCSPEKHAILSPALLLDVTSVGHHSPLVPYWLHGNNGDVQA